MIITDYHVKKVLRTYTRQLQRAKLPPEQLPKGEGKSPLFSGEIVEISEEARRRLVMEQITKQVTSKLENEKTLNSEKKDDKFIEDSEKPTETSNHVSGKGE